ncbi:right-handed parallel beta-helix repeat-containing protein [Geomonas sp. RF6]|uniref:right-handed parallel beta-helix repeat-containing protein n=1 Tax=Geomonas sp. RF6 TaxID=2897342 RepID=UPI001E4062C7|nr:right-handed parallel beta-helix repeat-containing protein [Geomonas sp. RF6]UFS71078.1 right-handed parallel beta-helix repeat-containing protein [Geomonas sp. RF6]
MLRHKIITKVVVLLTAITGYASFAGATYTVPATRAVTWAGNVGVKGDIPSISTVYTTLTPSGTDDTARIQTAINNCPAGQVVALAAGTFNVKSTLTVRKGIVLRGAGMGKTIVKGMSGFSGSQIILAEPSSWSYNLSSPGSVALSGGYKKGSTSITTASSHGLAVGDIILIDQVNNAADNPPVSNKGDGGSCTWCGRASGGRSLGQYVKVTAVPTSNSVTLEIPLYWDYDSTLSPQLVKVSNQVAGFGLESLTLDNSVSAAREAAMQWDNVNNSWILNVEMISAYKELFRIWNGYRNTIRGCKFHKGNPVTATSGTPFGGDRGYGIWLSGASAVAFENNEFFNLALAITMNGETSGNVFAYNYLHDLYHYSTGSAGQGVSFHGSHPIMNLIEGNYSKVSMVADNYWGSSSNNTFFRNRVINETGYNCKEYAINIYSHQQYYNVIGNVLGTSGIETTYDAAESSCAKAIYGFEDAAGKSTLLRHANWDSVTGGTVYNGSDDRVLPASLYLSTKPAWWGNTAWPAIGPDLSPMAPTAPSSGMPWGGVTKAPMAPSALKVQ